MPEKIIVPMQTKGENRRTIASSRIDGPHVQTGEASRAVEKNDVQNPVLGGILNIKASFYWSKKSTVEYPPLLPQEQDDAQEKGKLPSYEQLLKSIRVNDGNQCNGLRIAGLMNRTGNGTGNPIAAPHSFNQSRVASGSGSLELQTDTDISLDEIAAFNAYSSRTSSRSDPSTVMLNMDTGADAANNENMRRCTRKARRRYHDARPSNFCHVCQKSQRSQLRVVCYNIRRGLCRKVVCKQCCDENGWDWSKVSANLGSWICPHCTNTCPPRAQCFTYERTNERRRNGTMKKRKLSRHIEFGEKNLSQ